MAKEYDYKVKSLQKAIEVLNCFTEKPTWSVTELSKRLDLYKSNVFNILQTYKMMHYLEQNSESDRYHLGHGIFALSRSLGDTFSITRIAIPYMQALANETNERIYLAIPDEDEIIYLESMYPVQSIKLMRNILGERARMYCTAIGKAILAYLPENKINDFASRDFVQYTENTITNTEDLIAELSRIRLQGYSVDNMEHEFGIRCVAVPIFDRYSKVCAAISVSGSSLEIDDDRIEKLALLVKKQIIEIEKRL